MVYHPDEAEVAHEFCERAPGFGYACTWLPAEAVLRKSHAVNPDGLLGGIWSSAEMTVDPRQILATATGFSH